MDVTNEIKNQFLCSRTHPLPWIAVLETFGIYILFLPFVIALEKLAMVSLKYIAYA